MEPLIKKRISPQTLMLLKAALSNMFWRKADLISFLKFTIKSKHLIDSVNWYSNTTKTQGIGQLIDEMGAKQDTYQEDLFDLLYEAINFNDYSHFDKEEDKILKIQKAKEAIKNLRGNAKGFFDLLEEKNTIKKNKENYFSKVNENVKKGESLTLLKENFYKISAETNPQKRGFLLEPFLNDLFAYFDLDPKRSFKLTSNGEQIDGAFTFDSMDYILEAKWQSAPVSRKELHDFAGGIVDKFKFTAGLFVSINGFSKEILSGDSGNFKAMILMDGMDLNAVLEGRISLTDLLYRKRRHASQTGNIYINIAQILTS